MAIYGYCRVSTMRQATDGLSLEVQRRQIESYAQMMGFEGLEVFTEEGVSGSIPFHKRVQGGRLWKSLKRGDVLISSKLDRMFRSALDALTVIAEAEKHNFSLHLIDLGGDISNNSLSKLFLTIAAGFSESERDRIRERILQVKADQKNRGKYLGGFVPFGYTRSDSGNLILEPQGRYAINQILHLRSIGLPLREISQIMLTQGYVISHQGVSSVIKAHSAHT